MKYQAKPLPKITLPELKVIGKPLRRVDALPKSVGKTMYAGDYTLPNMLYGKVLRSNLPSANIKKLDASKARNFPGVVCVLTAEDLPDARLTSDLPGQTGQKRRAGTDVPVLASDVVCYVGEPLALIAAESEEIANHARELIVVEYDPIPGIFDPLDALKLDAPIIHPPDNVVARWKIRKGEVEIGMQDADVIVENTFRTPFIEHAYLEPEGGLAWVDEQGVINIRIGTQVIEHFRSIARAIGVPQNKVRVRGAMVGGGFGGKEDITIEIFLALLAQATRRPVQIIHSREESFIAQSKRHPYIITHRTGVKKNGKITAAEIDVLADSGAYPYITPWVLFYTTVMASGPYKIDNLRVDSVAVTTNQTFSSAFRGFGGTQACIAYEQQMDEIANVLGLDPLEVRRVNYLRTGDRDGTGQVMKSAVWLEETASRALEALGEKTADIGSIKHGWGFSSYFQSYGRMTWTHDTSSAWVGIEMDGSVVIRCGAPDIGAGQTNSLCQITSEYLGVPLERISSYSMDSALTPLAGTSTATRQLFMSGSAVSMAASTLRDNLLNRAQYHFKVSTNELDLADGQVFVKDNPEESLPLTDLVEMCAKEGIELENLAMFSAPFSEGLDPETGQGDIFPDFTFGSVAVEVAVDTESGELTLVKCAACHDVGRAINWAAVEGQIVGGCTQGLGHAMMEEYILKDGIPQTPSLTEYLVPTSVDFPPIQAIILESGTGVGPFGAKGIGEPSLTPAPAAVANAVADAIGTRVFSLPLTPEKILKALDQDSSK